MEKIAYSFIFFLAISCTSHESTVFELLQPDRTGVYFSNKVHESDTLNVLDYFYVYNGAGVAVGDVNNDGLDDIFFVANVKGQNKLYLNRGDLQFLDVTQHAGIAGRSDWSTGATMVDINSDGWLDVYVSTVDIKGVFSSRNELYVNNKDGTFSESAGAYGLDFAGHSTQAAFFDYDNDYLLDCYLLNHSINNIDFYRPSGNRNIVDSLSGGKLFHAEKTNAGIFYKLIPPGKNTYYSSILSYGLGISVGDLNNDGWMDFYATNDFKENDYCYINNGNGTFTDKGSRIFGHHSRFSMGCDMADYNNDCRLDIITLDMLADDEAIIKSSIGDEFSDVYDYKLSLGFYNQYSRNCLQKNLPSGDSIFFSDVGLQAGVAATDWSWSPLLADFDNDGFKDLFISNGYLYRANDLDFNKFKSAEILKKKTSNASSKFLNLVAEMPDGRYHDFIFKGTGSDQFLDKSKEWGFVEADLSHGAAYSDLDNDGDLDLIVNRMNQPAAIYENKTNSAKTNSLSIKLQGEDGNSLGLGAAVYAFSKNSFQMVHQMPTRGFMSSVSPILHVGVSDAKVIDSLMIIWPSGYGEVMKNVAANQRIVAYEKNALTKYSRPVVTQQGALQVKDVTNELGIKWKHRASDFNDFSINPLIPHKISTLGPRIAVADINKDGNDDFFVYNSFHTPVYNDHKTLSISGGRDSSVIFSINTPSQVVDALFFDADGDSDPDLITVSGGNQYFGADTRLRDHLYINDGNGNFQEDARFPPLYENKSCVRSCDVDKDGDLDLFIGGRVNGRMYGMTPGSTLLLNDGSGLFTPVTETFAPQLSFVGMTTDAVWHDIDNDGWTDLLVAGEFMPITFFKNDKGKALTKTSFLQQRSEGLWNFITGLDYDHDGDQDFILGNWGNNSKLKATIDKPLKLYMFDYDNNGDFDPLLCINREGKYYPFLSKEDLEKRLPSLKKQYLQYSDMAGKTAEQIFGDKLKKARVLEATTLESSLLLNENGRFNLLPLPVELQTAPLFSIQPIKHGNGQYFIAGGNFYGTQPYEGRYDALPLTIFDLMQEGGYIKMKQMQFVYLPGEVSDIRILRAREGNSYYLVARNDEPLVALQIELDTQ
jgi:enediyne biosynthesis protein E4